ncbi:2-phospho-L-lactate guanylyltransferase [Halococcus saccharolyticus]|uniref:2-phospho-L-lactate guanylyltransferase n=1 Tax=Halococcus saccharolyticus DSM 5350 TaxID=1227455 RepID=M0MBU3_9EURY|nr:2-phospho-L-lactate guanylyltransferase [Halococcus saccharolyticus]EMA43216.1 phospholactate guanylyltransferase [Halococcus saccharolyticus DSM 5350]
MQVVVPFDPQSPKTRLAGVLDPTERKRFARAMLRDVLDAITATGMAPTVLSTATLDIDAETRLDERPLTSAVNAALEDAGSTPVAVVMADLALATPAALSELFETEDDIVLARGIGGGTNALVARHPDFRVDYHGASYRDHHAVADAVGASTAEIDSYRLGMDIDEPEDLAELLLHGDGHAARWLRTAGVRLVEEQGRVSVGREPIPVTTTAESDAADD